MYKHFFKRLIDFTIALVALSIIWPFLLIVTIWLLFANKGAGAFFFQERPGKNAKIFKVVKFKTMTDERDAESADTGVPVRLSDGGAAAGGATDSPGAEEGVAREAVRGVD